ncbi:MAG: hypothetical protein J7K87_03820 [Candidatus Aenigmarchaeota archaeon]|nr:hypothetical protein [Candidatus Aenigmarchaeota archaeon]
MKIKIVKKIENPLLKRKELIGVIEHNSSSTPSKASVQAYIAKELKVMPKHVEVKRIISSIGASRSDLLAYLWKEREVPVLSDKKKEGKEKAKEEGGQTATAAQ